MPDAHFSIRPADTDDLPALLTLYRHLQPNDPELDPKVADERFAQILNQPGMKVLLGFAGSVAAATVTLITVPNLTRGGACYALIENVVTHANHRKQGYASALVRHAFSEAWQQDCYKVMLLTGSQDPATLRFYQNCGFVQDKTGFQIRRPISL